jgi:hypothetical protein
VKALEIRGESGEFRITPEMQRELDWTDAVLVRAAINDYLATHPFVEVQYFHDPTTGDDLVRWRKR